MAVRIVQLGSPARPARGTRIGTVRRPPRGVSKSNSRRRTGMTCGTPTSRPARDRQTGPGRRPPQEWAAFARKYRAEMGTPKTATLALLAHMSQDAISRSVATAKRSALPPFGAARTAGRGRGTDHAVTSAEPLDALLTRVRACRLCAAHLPLGPRPVLQAHASARILIAGQAPGRKVHASGVPFDDASGERLRAWLGMGRETFYDPRQVAILPMGFATRHGPLRRPAAAPECAPAWRQSLLGHLPHAPAPDAGAGSVRAGLASAGPPGHAHRRRAAMAQPRPPPCWPCRTPVRATTAGCGRTRGSRRNCCRSCVHG